MKTGKVRTVMLSERAKEALRRIKRGNGYLLPGRDAGSHMNRATIWRHFQKAVKAAGLTGKGYTVHSLRKCYAVNLFRKVRSVEAVQRDLNHDRWITTMIYLAELLLDAASH